MSEASVGLIVGSAFAYAQLDRQLHEVVETRFGRTSSPLMTLRLGEARVTAIARHGLNNEYAPDAVNYRANIQALRDHGITHCLALNIVGGIVSSLVPGTLAVPHQLIDYTSGRPGSFGGPDGSVLHIEFTEPFSGDLRVVLEASCDAQGLPVHRGVYAVTQGPRLETAAEIDRLDRDGCAMVGMTAMPEAALAREAGIEYAILAGVVNHAAGRAPGGESIHSQMREALDAILAGSQGVLARAVTALAAKSGNM